MIIWRHFACWISKTTRAQVHARASAPARTHAFMHVRAHTHTEICYIYWFSTATTTFS